MFAWSSIFIYGGESLVAGIHRSYMHEQFFGLRRRTEELVSYSVQRLWFITLKTASFFALIGSTLIMVYLLLKFNLIDMRQPRKVAIVALVLISVWVAMVFEMLSASSSASGWEDQSRIV